MVGLLSERQRLSRPATPLAAEEAEVTTTKVSGSPEIGDDFCKDCGYEPELKRTLGSFQMFAISFAAISVAVGVFGTYDDQLQTAGPVGIWLFALVAVGQLLVALVYAQFASRIPLSGSSYQWGSRLANPKIGWVFGWLYCCTLALGVVTIDNALASQSFMPLLGMPADEGTARLITLAALLIQVVLVIASTRLLSMINTSAVALELGLVVVMSIALFVAVAITGTGSVDNLASRGITEHVPNYFGVGGGLMAALLVGMATLQGFEAAANLAEEAKDPFRSVPRAIVGSTAAAGLLGMVFLIALTVAIKDIPRVSAGESSVAMIIGEQLGPVTERALLAAITFAFFGAGMVTLATAARMVFAMSRDERFPGHQLFRRVDARTHTPVPATILIFAVGVILMVGLPGAALLKLIQATSILPAIIYGATIVLYLAVRGRLDRRAGGFDLGRFEVPVAIGALAWIVFALFALVTPPNAVVSVVIVVGLLLLGAVYLAYLWLAKREVLEHEPGKELFEVEAEAAK
jgi:amino acid transporter